MKKLLLYILVFVAVINCANGQVNTTSLLDTSFNNTGIKTVDLSLGNDKLMDMYELADGAILTTSTPLNQYVAISKLNQDGTIDNTFGVDGISKLFFNSIDSIIYSVNLSKIRVWPNGKILIYTNVTHIKNVINDPVNPGGIGTISNNYSYRFEKSYLHQLNQNGSIDTNFANHGVMLIGDSTNEEYKYPVAYDILIQDGNKVLISGAFGKPDQGSMHSFYYQKGFLYRVSINGLLDSTFAVNGLHINQSFSLPYLAINHNGNIIIGGIRYLLGTSFSVPDFSMLTQGGSQYLNFSPHFPISDSLKFVPASMSIGANNEIFFFGTYSVKCDTCLPYVLSFAKFLSNGNLDTSYATNGFRMYQFNNNSGYANTHIKLNDGSILALAKVPATTQRALLFKLSENGDLVNDFGVNGSYYLHSDISTYSSYKLINRIIYNSDNEKIISGGTYVTPNNSSSKPLLIRLNDRSIPLGLIDNPTITQEILAYPNPIQSGTLNLSYELTNKQDVAVDLYNLQGQLVTSLVAKQPRQKGSNSEVLNLPQSLTAGHYILRITAGNYQKGVQVVLE